MCIRDSYYSDVLLLNVDEKEKEKVRVPKSSPLFKLNPFLDKEGILRVRSRLQFSSLSYEEKNPIIIPKGHVAEKLVEFQHKFLKHGGVQSMVTSLRGSYWIVGLRRIAKGVKRNCVPCCRIDALPCNAPVAPLPQLRATEAPPFSITGLDNAGPVYCVDLPGKKLYILLLTCAVVRAVHLELVDSMSTEDFLLGLRRFSARRGLPSVIYSDNGSNFACGEKELRSYFGHLCPEWKFTVPGSPWWGGWWERLVRSVKSGLKKSIGNACLTRAELETCLHEVEACVNSRPISFVGDTSECPNPLTPSHFLIGKGAGFDTKILEDPENVDVRMLEDREVMRQERLDVFWEVWQKDYLEICLLSYRNFSKEASSLLARLC